MSEIDDGFKLDVQIKGQMEPEIHLAGGYCPGGLCLYRYYRIVDKALVQRMAFRQRFGDTALVFHPVLDPDIAGI